MTLAQYDRKEEIKRLMVELEDMRENRIISPGECAQRFAALNDEFKAITGSYYTTGRTLVEPVRTHVHHERAYLHFR